MSPAWPKPEPKAKKARQGLKRTRLKRKSARRISRETPAEKHWKAWIHTRACVGAGSLFDHVCDFGLSPFWAVEQAHFRNHTGASLKEDNFQSLPMCHGLHRHYDSGAGPFSPMGTEGKKVWFQARLIEVRADFELEHGCTAEEWEASKR